MMSDKEEIRVTITEAELLRLRTALADYYGTAVHNGFPMAVRDLVNIDSMTDEEVIQDALEKGIVSLY